MKKLFTTLLIIISLSVSAQKDSTILTIKGNIQAFQALINALDKSDAPHKEVEALKLWIINQLNEQLKKDKKK